MPGNVLDSFALIAYLRDERGGEAVENLLISAVKKGMPVHMSEVNYAEVKYSILRKDGTAAWKEAVEVINGLPIEFHSTSRAMADSAAEFKSRHKISLADAFAAALAKEKNADLVTGDPEFRALEKELKIFWLTA
jgi:ribonuclease VapC